MKSKVVYVPCFRCSMREGCSALKHLMDVRSDFSENHEEVAITSIKVRCLQYEQQFLPGDRVRFTVMEMRDEVPIVATGTVMRYNHRKMKYIIWVDEDSIDEGVDHTIIHLDAARLTALPEASIEVCPECGRPKGAEIPGRSDWNCNTCGKPYWEDGL